MSNDLISGWADLYDYAREMERRGPLKPTEDHLKLLKAAYWSWNDCEFGAASMDPKRPYGNSDVLNDLAELLPHLDKEARVRAHCELPAVLAYVTKHLPTAEEA